MRWFLFALSLSCFAFPALAETPPDGGPPAQPPEDDIGFVPLVDENAPLTVIWFTEGTEVPIEDASGVEGQIYEEFSKRMDLRLVSREKTKKTVDGTGKMELQQCKWENPCLFTIAKMLEADRIIGVKMTGSGGTYYLAFKRIDVDKDPPTWLTSFIDGGLSTLLMSEIAKGVKAACEQKTRPMPKKMLERKPTSQAPAADPDGLPAPLPLTPPQPAVEPTPQEDKTPPVRTAAVDPEPQQDKTPPARTAAVELPPEPKKAVIILPPPPKAEVIEPAPSDEVVASPDRPGFFRRHLGSTIALGASLVLAGTGIGFGVMADQAQKDVEYQWDPARDQDGKDNALAANVLFGLAGAAVVTAVVLFFIEPSADEAIIASAAPAGASALFRF